MQAVGRLLPPSYVFEGMRSVINGQAFPPGQLALGGALAVLEIAVAALVFSRVYRYAVRTGLLARYSAESAA
jgi:ABC-2 type transport system permease protein